MIKKILVVDDDAEMRELLGTLLTNANYDVSLLAKAEHIFETVKRFDPDLILLDGMLGGLDGAMICNTLKVDPATKYIPIIFVSGNYKYASNLNTIGAPDDFVLKPFSIKDLLGKIQYQLAA